MILGAEAGPQDLYTGRGVGKWGTTWAETCCAAPGPNEA